MSRLSVPIWEGGGGGGLHPECDQQVDLLCVMGSGQCDRPLVPISN